MADERRQLDGRHAVGPTRSWSGALGRVGQRFVINAKLLDVRTEEALGLA